MFILHPFIDGKVWGLLEDIVDQQKIINRLLIQYDFAISSSAKGVLLVPEEVIHEDFDLDKIAEEWTKFNGVIKIKLKKGLTRDHLPQQISTNATNFGINEFLATEMRLIQEISGVSAAAQGQTAKSGTPSSLYAQEAQNSSVNLKDVFESYSHLLKKRDTKIMKLLLQYYDETTQLYAMDSRESLKVTEWDPAKMRSVDFDLKVIQGTDTPVYRQLMDSSLMEMLKSNMITLEMYLKNSSLPFAESLLKDLRLEKESMANAQQGQISEGTSAKLTQAQQQLEQGMSPQQLEMVKRLSQVS